MVKTADVVLRLMLAWDPPLFCAVRVRLRYDSAYVLETDDAVDQAYILGLAQGREETALIGRVVKTGRSQERVRMTDNS